MRGSAADILVRYLEQEGVEHVFGVPGGHLLPFFDAVQRSGRIRAVLTRHEAGAAFMAQGYAVATGRLGVCCATVGPGATNLITGIASAYVDSTPVLALTAQVGTGVIGRGALQEGAGVGRTIDQVGLFSGITKLSTMVLRGESLPRTLRRALRVAHSGRPGPVHLDLPADVQAERIEDAILPVASYRPTGSAALDPSQVAQAAELLKGARRPAILVGYGATSAWGRHGSLRALAERLGAPVATTLRAKGALCEEHPLALGCAGLYGTRAANAYLTSGVDVLLTLGASFHEFTSNVWDPALMPSRALIQVDVDPGEIGKNYPATLSMVGDARHAITALLDALGEGAARPRCLRELKREHEYFDEPVMRSPALPLKPQRLMRELRRAIPREAIVFADIGNTIPWAERYFPAHPEGRFIVLSGLAAMGSAVAACIGGQLGRPQSPVVCLCGDGAFHMSGMEIATAAELGLPIVWVVLKNGKLGMIHDVQRVSYQKRHVAAHVAETDFAALAESLGCRGARVARPEEVEPAVREALAAGRPCVIEVTIDPEEMPPMKPRMAAMRRPLGLPNPVKGVSVDTLRAVWRMAQRR